MPLRFTALEYLLARLNLLPTPLFDVPLSAGISTALYTACKLGLFDSLRTRGQTVSELADRLQCHPQGLLYLLQLLVSSGYLRQHKGRYYNTRISQRWLVSSSRQNLIPYILHGPDLANIWAHLDEIIHTNQAAMKTPYEESSTTAESRQLLERHYAGLAALASMIGPEILRRVPLPQPATRLLDVGGSHAAYSALFCRAYPGLHATVIDLEAGVEAGTHTVQRLGLEQRIQFMCCDIVSDDFPEHFSEPFDVALYFNIAHLLQPEDNQAVLHKVAHTLRPGGLLILVDQLPDQRQRSRLSALTTQLMQLSVTIIGGTCHPFSDVRYWLERAGMEQIRKHEMLTPGTCFVTARKRNETKKRSGD